MNKSTIAKMELFCTILMVSVLVPRLATSILAPDDFLNAVAMKTMWRECIGEEMANFIEARVRGAVNQCKSQAQNLEAFPRNSDNFSVQGSPDSNTLDGQGRSFDTKSKDFSQRKGGGSEARRDERVGKSNRRRSEDERKERRNDEDDSTYSVREQRRNTEQNRDSGEKRGGGKRSSRRDDERNTRSRNNKDYDYDYEESDRRSSDRSRKEDRRSNRKNNERNQGRDDRRKSAKDNSDDQPYEGRNRNKNKDGRDDRRGRENNRGFSDYDERETPRRGRDRSRDTSERRGKQGYDSYGVPPVSDGNDGTKDDESGDDGSSGGNMYGNMYGGDAGGDTGDGGGVDDGGDSGGGDTGDGGGDYGGSDDGGDVGGGDDGGDVGGGDDGGGDGGIVITIDKDKPKSRKGYPKAPIPDDIKPVYFTLIDQIPFLLQSDGFDTGYGYGTYGRSKRQSNDNRKLSIQELADGERRVKTQLSNFSCILDTLNMMDDKGEVKVSDLISDLNSLNIDQNLKQDLESGIRFCARLTTCLPEDEKDTFLPRHLQQAIFFFTCNQKRRQLACFKKDIRNYLDETVPQEIQGSYDRETTVNRVMYIKMENSFKGLQEFI